MKKDMIILGIDGGGTKTEAVAVNRDGCIIGRYVTVGCNPNDMGIEKSAEIISSCISHLAPVNAVVFAGVGGATNHRENLLERLKPNFPNCKIDVRSDAANMIACEIPDGDGACIICGTGSSCFVRKNGEIKRIGGWGYLIDSAGDGFSIGKAVIDSALREYDGRGEKTLLTQLIKEKAGKPAEELITEIYGGGRAYIASFAELALTASEKGDAVAHGILLKNAKYIAELLDAGCKYAGNSIKFVMGGGINANFGAQWIECIISQTEFKPELIIPEMPPVYGAVVCAAQMAGVAVTEKFKTNFSEDYNETQ